MTKFKRILASLVSVVALVSASSVIASAENYYSSSEDYVNNVSASTNTFVNQSRNNPYTTTTTDYVLHSMYDRNGGNYSLTGIYGAQPFVVGLVDPYYRCAIVRAYNSNGGILANSGYVYSGANNVTALAQIANNTYSSQIDYVTFYGDCRVNQNQSGTGYLHLSCRLNLN